MCLPQLTHFHVEPLKQELLVLTSVAYSTKGSLDFVCFLNPRQASTRILPSQAFLDCEYQLGITSQFHITCPFGITVLSLSLRQICYLQILFWICTFWLLDQSTPLDSTATSQRLRSNGGRQPLHPKRCALISPHLYLDGQSQVDT